MIETMQLRIARSISYMGMHLRERITREELAAVAEMNPEQYSKSFKKMTGRTPTEYLTELRIARAQQLLQETPLTVKEVALRTGFDDPFYFSRRFKQATGRSPSERARGVGPRVAALEYYGHLRALGITPVAIDGQAEGLAGYLADWPAYAEDVNWNGDDADIGRIAAWRPDWIVTHERRHAAALSTVARVVVVPIDEDPIYSQLPALGQALELESRAASWIAGYEGRLATLRAVACAYFAERPVLILRIRADVLQVYGNTVIGYAFYRSLDLKPPYKLQRQFDITDRYHSTVIDLEDLTAYEAEHLFVVVQHDEASRERWASISQSAIWRSLPAVQRGHVYELDVHRWLAADPISIIRQSEEIAGFAAERTGRKGT